MWRSRTNKDRKTVVCIACGASVPQTDAREYDKEGNRWERHGKEFEYLCKGCHGNLCHQPRDELESLLLEVERDSLSREEFLADYVGAVERRYGSAGGPES